MHGAIRDDIEELDIDLRDIDAGTCKELQIDLNDFDEDKGDDE